MRWQDHLTDVRDLEAGPPGDLAPLAFVDLGTAVDVEFAPPPFPLIGVGDPAHPLTRRLDAVIEPPMTADSLLRSVAANPRAAAVAVDLLRSAEGVPIMPALVMESIAYFRQATSMRAGALRGRGMSLRPKAASASLAIENCSIS